jgi:hypothetical protein
MLGTAARGWGIGGGGRLRLEGVTVIQIHGTTKKRNDAVSGCDFAMLTLCANEGLKHKVLDYARVRDLAGTRLASLFPCGL